MSIGELLRAHGLAPKKRFGQNFLVDPRAARLIAEAATTPTGGTVVEIGPGLGALTRHLVERAGRVTVLERDRDLVPILRAEVPGIHEIVEGDALDADWAAHLRDGPRPHVLVGNLPYSITGRLVERAVQIADELDRAVFMVQAEVADRLLSAPDTSEYGALSVFVQAAFKPTRLLSAKAGAFFPRPEVDSAVVVLEPMRPRRAAETDAFRSVVKAAFGARRKTLRNAWRGLFGWTREELEEHARAVGVSLDARGETLDVDAFAAIADLATSTATPDADPEKGRES